MNIHRNLQWTVVMKVKRTNEQEHRKHSCHHPPRGRINGRQAMDRMRKQMKDSNTKHQTANKTDDRLHAVV